MFSYKDKIKKVRKFEKLSQTEFANKTGVSRSYIAQIELGNKVPSIQYLEKVIEIFKLNKKFFFADDSGEVNLDLIENNIHQIPDNNSLNENLLDTQSMILEMSRIHSEIHHYYQRLIDIKLMSNKLDNAEIENGLQEFITKFSVIMNGYYNDISASKGLLGRFEDTPSTDIKTLNKDERKEYMIKLYNERKTFEYVFFHYFRKFYNKYMEDWYKGFSK